MINNYEGFCRELDKGNITPDVSSPLGAKTVNTLRENGWEIGIWRAKSDLLKICRQSEENFEFAYRTGINRAIIPKTYGYRFEPHFIEFLYEIKYRF